MKKGKLSVILLGMIFMLSGCKDTNKELAEEKVVYFLEGYKQKDETISELLLGTTATDSMSFEGVSAFFAEELEYEIKSCKEDEEDLYSVEVEVQTIDFEQLFSSSYEQTIEKYGEEGITENFMSEMEKNIEKREFEINKVTCNVVVRKLNDEFKIQMDNSFANALTGGMNEYLDSLQGGN